MSLWLRLYTSALDSEKLHTLPGELYKFWSQMIMVAKEYGGILPPAKTIAFKMHLWNSPPPDETLHETLQATSDATSGERFVQRCLQQLIERRLIDEITVGNEKKLTPHDWREHQYDSDSSTERNRKWRQRQKLNGETFDATSRQRPKQRPMQRLKDGRETAQSRADTSTEAFQDSGTLEKNRNSGGGETLGNDRRGRKPRNTPPPPATDLFPKAFHTANTLFPTDPKLFAEIIERGIAVAPNLADDDMAKVLFNSKRPHQRSAVLWKDLVPEYLASPANGRWKHPKYNCRTCGDTGQIEAPWVDRDEFMNRPEPEKWISCPERCDAARKKTGQAKKRIQASAGATGAGR